MPRRVSDLAAAREVGFGVGDDDAGAGPGGRAVEDAADGAVGEDVADAELVGVVDPFNDVGTGVDAGALAGESEFGHGVGSGDGCEGLVDGGGKGAEGGEDGGGVGVGQVGGLFGGADDGAVEGGWVIGGWRD